MLGHNTHHNDPTCSHKSGGQYAGLRAAQVVHPRKVTRHVTPGAGIHEIASTVLVILVHALDGMQQPCVGTIIRNRAHDHWTGLELYNG